MICSTAEPAATVGASVLSKTRACLHSTPFPAQGMTTKLVDSFGHRCLQAGDEGADADSLHYLEPLSSEPVQPSVSGAIRLRRLDTKRGLSCPILIFRAGPPLRGQPGSCCSWAKHRGHLLLLDLSVGRLCWFSPEFWGFRGVSSVGILQSRDSRLLNCRALR